MVANKGTDLLRMRLASLSRLKFKQESHKQLSILAKSIHYMGQIDQNFLDPLNFITIHFCFYVSCLFSTRNVFTVILKQLTGYQSASTISFILKYKIGQHDEFQGFKYISCSICFAYQYYQFL